MHNNSYQMNFSNQNGNYSGMQQMRMNNHNQYYSQQFNKHRSGSMNQSGHSNENNNQHYAQQNPRQNNNLYYVPQSNQNNFYSMNTNQQNNMFHHQQINQQNSQVNNRFNQNNNAMLDQFNQYQKANSMQGLSNVINSNPFLAKNPHYKDPTQNAIKNIENVKQLEQIKQFQKKNSQKTLDDKSLLKFIILQPLSVNKKELNNTDVNPEFKKLSSNFSGDAAKLHSHRTNNPYKIIAKDHYGKSVRELEDFLKDITAKKGNGFQLEKILQKKKAIQDVLKRVTINKVSKKDKDIKRLKKQYDKEANQREELDDYHRIIYSKDKKLEHLNKYNKEYKFVYRISHDTKGHAELREDRISYYENLQKKMEEGKKSRDEIFRQLEEEGLITEKDYGDDNTIGTMEPSEIEEIKVHKTKKTSHKKSDMDDIERALEYADSLLEKKPKKIFDRSDNQESDSDKKSDKNKKSKKSDSRKETDSDKKSKSKVCKDSNKNSDSEKNNDNNKKSKSKVRKDSDKNSDDENSNKKSNSENKKKAKIKSDKKSKKTDESDNESEKKLKQKKAVIKSNKNSDDEKNEDSDIEIVIEPRKKSKLLKKKHKSSDSDEIIV